MVWNWPVLPVIPWVMTLVSLLIKIDIYKSLTIFLFRSGNDFGRGFGHGVGTDDGQARLGQQFFAEFFVGPLPAHDQRHATIRSEERRVGKECVSTCRSRWLTSL